MKRKPFPRPRLGTAGAAALSVATPLRIAIVCLCWGTIGLPQSRGDEGGEAARTAAEVGDGRHFETTIAPLLTRHCTECHGSAAKKGRLDLSRKAVAFAGGDSGRAILAGDADASLLWELVESDEMPENRPPLSAREKQILRQWIEDGALWPDDAIVGGTPDDDVLASNWLRRLTVPEYIQTVWQAVGVDVEHEARQILPRDLRADGFSNTAYSLGVDLEHVEAYAKLAELIVGRMDVAAFAAEHASCQELTEKCMPETIARIGKWLLRGPLEEHELNAFLQVSNAVAEEGGDFNEAITYVIETMLQSPRFLYRIEQQQSGSETQRLDAYELASRMSYILWGGPPDKELVRAADAGELANRQGVERQVRRMVEDPRTVARSSEFISEWLNLEQLDYLQPNPKRFPDWTPAIAADMREETRAFFNEVVWKQKRPLWDLMNAEVTFLTPRLAEHYGLEGPGSAAAEAPAGIDATDREIPSGRVRRSAAEPHTEGLQALYTFGEGSGQTVRDLSGSGAAIDLKIEDPKAVSWGPKGLEVQGATRIASDGPPKRLLAAIDKSNALTLEAWVTPANVSQNGPARLLTLSSGVSKRNFTLGQDGNQYEVRLRATQTDINGMPGLASPSGTAVTQPTHIVFTRDSGAQTRLFIDGVEIARRYVQGDLSNWDGSFTLTLANESTGDRPWLGSLHRIAIYSRALSPQEVLSASRINTPVQRYDLAAVPARGGLLTQGSVLTIGGDGASMVSRGLFILQDLLDSEVGNPPPCLDTTPVPPKPGLSQREIAMGRVNSAACGGCHSRIEPLAFGLEKFDGLGAYQEQDEHGNKLREDGEIKIPGNEQPLAFETSEELMDLLAESERVRMNLTRKVTQFAVGRPLVESDAVLVEAIHRSAQAGGGTYASLMTAIVMSDLVQMTSPESDR